MIGDGWDFPSRFLLDTAALGHAVNENATERHPMLRMTLAATAIAAILPITNVLADETPAGTMPLPPLETTPEKFSYGLGMQVASSLIQQGIMEGLDPPSFALGLLDQLQGSEPRLTLEQIQEAYTEMQVIMAAAAEAEAAKATERGNAFLAENATVEGVTVTDSGLQYQVVQAGAAEGPSPELADQVRVHYRGELLDGSVFDSSYERDAPAEFGVGQVIAGWQEVLQLMRPGDIWDVWIPSTLAYGEQGAGDQIGANETLKFRIELLDILE